MKVLMSSHGPPLRLISIIPPSKKIGGELPKSASKLPRWSTAITNGAAVPTSRAGDSSAVSDGPPKSRPYHARLNGVTSTRDQIVSASAPDAVQGVDAVSTVSI